MKPTPDVKLDDFILELTKEFLYGTRETRKSTRTIVCPECDAQDADCYLCEGAGEVPGCPYCRGTGDVVVPGEAYDNDDPAYEECEDCAGSGTAIPIVTKEIH